MTMLNDKPSFVIDTIYAWLLDNQSVEQDLSQEQTRAAIELTTQQLGYNAPFNAEQKAINEMLFDKKANAQTCKAVWGFYRDYTKDDIDSVHAV